MAERCAEVPPGRPGCKETPVDVGFRRRLGDVADGEQERRCRTETCVECCVQQHPGGIEPLDALSTEGEGLGARQQFLGLEPEAEWTEDERAMEVDLEAEDGRVNLRVRDDGNGFDPGAISRAGANGPGGHLGLTGMAERARLAGGELDVRSAPGSGTTVSFRIGTP